MPRCVRPRRWKGSNSPRGPAPEFCCPPWAPAQPPPTRSRLPSSRRDRWGLQPALLRRLCRCCPRRRERPTLRPAHWQRCLPLTRVAQSCLRRLPRPAEGLWPNPCRQTSSWQGRQGRQSRWHLPRLPSGEERPQDPRLRRRRRPSGSQPVKP